MHRLPGILLAALFIACSARKTELIIAGSTSIQPFIEKIAEHYAVVYPEYKVSVQGGGSTAGIQATLNHTCQIGMSSRNLKPEEQEILTFLIAFDGIAIVINKTNPVAGLSTEQLRKIFTGEIKNWRELGGPDRRIYPVTREDGSGTRGAFEELVMHKSAISDACLVQDSNGAVREIVANTPEAIGYISSGLIDQRVNALALDSIPPTFENIASCRYRIVRPFLLLTSQPPAGPVKQFIDYCMSLDGQDILRQSGLIPAMDISR